tara:strand:+ start:136 stop:966 length:831 start_codon:yes stop_codon:yes gene_type:complete
MSDEVWMGYLLHHEASYTVVQSPFVLGGQRVFGADSDATTLAVAALLHRLEHDDVSAISVPEGIDASSLSAATDVALHNPDAEEEAPWEVLMSDEAIVVVSQRGATVEIPVFDVEVEVDTDFYAAIEAAWNQELSENHVSQGAYVSRAQYDEAAASRLQLHGQTNEQGVVWPPRFSHVVDGHSTSGMRLQRCGKVMTWTTLSAAGAPSEFSLRAPVLGGVSTVLLELDDGPNGVFLLVDDEESIIEMDARMELVFRRLYAQEGFVRYGLKARSIHD